LTKQFSPQSHGERRVYSLICFPLRGRKTNNNKPYGNTAFYSKACSYVHSDYPDCHHAVDLFFSGLPALWNAEPIPLGLAEKKTYFFSANSASRAKWAVKNILSLTRIVKLGPSA